MGSREGHACRQAGFTLIEAVFSVMILAVFSAAIIGMMIAALSAANSAKLSNRAVALAEQGVEQARAFYQNNKWSILSGKPAGCYPDGTSFSTIVPGSSCSSSPLTQQGNCGFVSVTPQNRLYPYVRLSFPVSGKAFLQSFVGWADKGNCRLEEVDTYFYNY